ncbi:MAG: arginine--tRNA ligase [Methanobacteriaceae archaeon]|jgi:arginyl-tRNA synthetase|uniref:arginine--tRNA ligase n=1 Tax=Methanobrevibacter TaxID=2172 RepID=UPI0037653268|nr:arginine--tRNA ligase [Methanobacteriaceae archaeon]MDD4593928.1 arginine--tRNA ligase [Methanobacteriaceae archaeon]
MNIAVKDEAFKSLKNLLDKKGYDIPDNEIKLEFPPNPELGDLATTLTFSLAKILKKSPNLIAQDLVKEIEFPKIFDKVEAKGPYLNFFINYDIFSKELLKSIKKNYGQLPNKDEKIVLEHTSANPNGPLHVGHIRNSIIGDSLSRVLKKSGRDVETQYYVNDMGRQIAIIVFGITELGLKIEDQEGDKIDHKIGQLYFKANQKLNENKELTSNVDDLIQKYEKGDDAELNKIFENVVSQCINGVKETLSRMNIIHDDFVWEGQFVRDGTVDKITDELYEIGYARKSDVLYLDLTEWDIDKELVLRRANGTSLYSTRDIAYHIHKCQQGDIVLDVLGADHKLAFKQVSLALEILEVVEPNSDELEVVFYEFINLPDGSMSTRKGIFVSVDDLIDEAVSRARKELDERRPDLSDEELNNISEEIGIGAIRFYIARLSPEKPITFKWDEALSFERGCASIQYAHARACKLLKKAGDKELSIEDNWSPDDVEKDLIRNLAKFPEVIENSASSRHVHPIAQYCQDLSSAFNKFYKSEQVLGSEFEGVRLNIVKKSQITLKNALDLLGVPAPEMM